MSKDDLNIFMLMGQSNMAGRGELDDVEPIEHPDILMFRAGRWIQAKEPLHDDKASAGVGPGMSFAMSLLEEYGPCRIGLVPCAVGGTPLSRWVEGADLYLRAIALAGKASRCGPIKGILWHQGENDGLREDLARTYYDRLAPMFRALRSDLGDDKLPLLIGELGDFWVAKGEPFEMVNSALLRTADELDICGLAGAAGLVHKGDEAHFDSASERQFGLRYAEEYKRLISTRLVQLV